MDAHHRPHLAHSREQLIHALYEAAELEHNLMCTYLYAAFSLRSGAEEGLAPAEAPAVEAWRNTIVGVAIEEMGHLMTVWNITMALGGAPRVGRMNFPLDAGYLPAGIVVKLAPFNLNTLQHFIFLERAQGSDEPEGTGFACERWFARGNQNARLTPMGMDYETVGEFYEALKQSLVTLVQRVGEGEAFRGEPTQQISGAPFGFANIRPVRCLKTALQAFDAIVAQGEGAPADGERSHFQQFLKIRSEFQTLVLSNPKFAPGFPAATNPVLRRPPNPQGRVWLEDAHAIAAVDLANASYGLMLRLMAYAFALPPSDQAQKIATLNLAIGLMRAVTPLGEHAARLPAGPSNPDCHAGMSFTTLRDSGAFPKARAAEAFFVDRLQELVDAAHALAVDGAPRAARAAAALVEVAARARELFPGTAAGTGNAPALAASDLDAPASTDEVEVVAGNDIKILFHGARCIHSRFCVTGAPRVFLANVQGPWIHPEAMPVERLVEVAHACPSGAIRYERLDGKPEESAPPVNLAGIREAGPYAFRGDLRLAGQKTGFRATLCRCGASKNKPFCDGSHHAIEFSATGEPPTQSTAGLPARDGPLHIDPQTDGPLRLRGNLEITSGTGRIIARVTEARLCRCGGSSNKPFCDGTHGRIGFKS